MKGELEELGEEVDDNIVSVSKMQTQILNLTHGKVNIFEADGKSFRNIYDIYSDIAKIYDDLSDKDQSALLELLAGKVRANQIQGMIRRWDDVEKATKKAYNSEGTAAKENEKYMNSMQGKINATKTSWEALSNSFLSSDLLKTAIDTAQTFLDTINKTVKATGALPPILAVISGYLSASKNIGILKLVDNKITFLGKSLKSFENIKRDFSSGHGLKTSLFSNAITQDDIERIKAFNTLTEKNIPTVKAWHNTMRGATVAGKEAAVQVKKGEISIQDLEKSLGATKKGFVGAKIAATAFNMALTYGISILISKGVEALNYYLHLQENIAKESKEYAEKTRTEASRRKENQDSLNELIDKYKEIAKNKKDEATFQKEAQDIQKKIIDLVGNQAGKIDLVNGSLETQLEKLKEITAENQKQIQQADILAARASGQSAKDAGYLNAPKIFGVIPNPLNIGADIAGESNNIYTTGVGNTKGSNLTSFELTANRIAKTSGYGVGITTAFDTLSVIFDEGMSMVERAKALEKIINELRPNFSDTDVYGKLVQLYQEMFGANSEYANALSAYKNLLEDNLALDQDAQKAEKANVNSYSEYLQLRQKLINNLNKSEGVREAKEAGWISDQDIAKAVDDYLGTIDSVAQYFVSSDTISKINEMKRLMSRNDISPEGRKKSKEFNNWLDTLSPEDKNLVVTIEFNAETAKMSVDEWKKKLDELKTSNATNVDEMINDFDSYKTKITDSTDILKNEIDSIGSTLKDVDSVIKDYNENGYFSTENLEKLSQNGQKYMSYLTYENGQLKINEEAYKKLVLAQIDEIETKATLQAITDLQSLTDETAAKQYLAKVNIELAQSQLTAAQAAFQYQLALKLAEGGNVAKAAQKVADNLNTLRNVFATAREQAQSYSGAMLGAATATDKKAKASEKAKIALEKEQRALEHSKKALEDQKKALEKEKTEYEKAQKAIEDLIKWTENYIKQIKEDEIKALEKKKDKFDEIIDKQKEALQAEKDLNDYEKSIAEKNNDLASKATSMDLASLDDSSAGRAAYKKAQEEYKQSKSDTNEFLRDHEIEMQEQALDKLKEDTDKHYENQISKLQEYLNNEVQLYRDACAMIDNDNGTLYNKLLNYALTYTTVGKIEFDRMWTLAQTAMERYNVASIGTMQFMDELKGRIYDVDDAIDAVSKNIETYEGRIDEVKNKLDDLKDAAVNAKNAIDAANNTPLNPTPNATPPKTNNTTTPPSNTKKKSAQDFANEASKTAGTLNNATNKALSDYNNKNKTIHYPTVAHATGTRSAKRSIAQINEQGLETLMRKTPNGDFVIMNQDDQVYTKKQTDNLYDFANDPDQFFANRGLTPLTQEELANLGLWGDSSRLGMINSAFGIGGLSGLVDKITGGNSTPTNNNTTNNNSMSPIVNITVQGDATQSTINALKAQAQGIVKDTMNQMMKVSIRNKFVI